MTDAKKKYEPNCEDEPDWQACEEALYTECSNAIARFAAENPTTQCAFFGFYCEPTYGTISINIETPEHAIETAKKEQDYNVQNRLRQFHEFGSKSTWEGVDYYLDKQCSAVHPQNVGAFQFAEYANVQFEDWEDFAEVFFENLPDDDSPEFDDAQNLAGELHKQYVKAHAMLVFWAVFERLISDGTLSTLNLASQCRLGYNFSDQANVSVVRIVNW